MKKYTYCIWDFNGTIVDDIALGMMAVNTMLSQRGLPTIPDRRVYRTRFDFPISEYYRGLGFDFDAEPYAELAEIWMDLYVKNLNMAGLFPDVVRALDFFEARGIKQSVLSASEIVLLKNQLADLGVFDRFEQIMGIDNIYGDSKLHIAREWRRLHPNEQVMFIGDTTHDCETARVLDADCYIVCAGHQSRERFLDLDVPIFDSLDELISAFATAEQGENK